ncbi:MAG: phytanoyl-CoA dioxygenase family protein [Chitinophagaceae bacterium]|nr:phytanoyl-CoA dioxygenase family protein [Chitinophagaceae bacterium]
MPPDELILPSSAETGAIGIMHLKRYWAKAVAKRNGLLPMDALQHEWETDNFLLNTLHLGLEQTLMKLFQDAPGFDDLEQWIIRVNQGMIDEERIQEFNAVLQSQGGFVPIAADEEKVLSAAEMEFWNDNGYVIVRNAISREDCEETVAFMCEQLDIDLNDPLSWYRPHVHREGIMVPLFQHPLIERNRRSPRIRKAYEQLWNRRDIMVNTDKLGFNPPETTGWKFPASRLHWDVSLVQPIPFGTQGILYLTDTSASQGAFTVVPGFHHRISDWLDALPAGNEPRKEDLYPLGAVPVAAAAGDLIIWHHALPHAASANRAAMPRFVQYLNYAPVFGGVQQEWK